MKLKNTIKILSIFLAVIIALVTLPLSVLAITSEEYVTGNNEETPNNIKPETNAREDPTGSNTEETEYESNFIEFETEICDDEFEEDDLGLSAPPLEDIGQTLDPNVVPLGVIDGVYEIENIGNPDFYIAVEGNYAVEGYRLLQKAYSGSTPLTNFTRSSLFKISKAPGTTDRYIIRSMLNNRLSIGVQGSKLVTTIIEADDSLVPASSTFTITFESGGFVIKPYGSSTVVAAPNSNASGDAGVPNSYISVSFASIAGTRGKWSLTRYSGEAKSGLTATRTASMGDGLVKGKSGNLWVKSWSTVIGANTVYVSVTSATSSMVSSVWNDTAGRATITGLKCGDFKMRAEIYVGSSNTAVYAGTYSYTVIPDIAGETGYLQNVATSKYAEIESASMAVDGVIQQSSFHTQPYMRWKFELDGNGYFRIKSEHSGLYLGAYSINPEKVRQYATITDYTRWKFIETSTGNYQIYCKAAGTRNMALALPSTTSADGVDLTNLIYTNDGNYNDEWDIYIVNYAATINNYYDKGYCVRYGENESTSRAEINNYNVAVAQVYLRLFGLLLYSNGAQYYNSPIDQCKGTVSASNIDTLCSHASVIHTDRSNVISSFKSYCSGNNTTTNVLWSCHKIKSIASNGNVNYNRSCSSGFYLYILKITTGNSRTIYSQGVLLHELNHQYGAKDHYHEEISPGVCKFADACSTCGTNPRPASCIMNNSRQDVNSPQIICNECIQDIIAHLDNHH